MLSSCVLSKVLQAAISMTTGKRSIRRMRLMVKTGGGKTLPDFKQGVNLQA